MYGEILSTETKTVFGKILAPAETIFQSSYCRDQYSEIIII